MFTSFIDKILKLILISIFVFLSLSYTQEGGKKISVFFQNAHLTEVLKFISEKNSINFVYNQSIVKDKIVTCKFQNSSLTAVLKEILKDTGLKIGYKAGNLITLIEIPIKLYDLSGRLVDAENQEPLPYANLKIKGQNIATVTDKNGRFSFVNLRTCKLNLIAKYLGYNENVISVNCNTEKFLEIELEKSPFIMEDIEVVDSKNQFIEISNTPGLFAVSPRTYENLPIFNSPDLIRTLQLLPGITSNGGGNAEIHIRGGIPSENLMTLDGLQLYHLNHFYGFFSSISSNSIKDIRIFKGGFPARYGSKISGVIDMSSKNGSLNKPKVVLGINNLNLNLAVEIPISKKFSLFLSGRRILFPEVLHENYKSIIENKVESDSYIGSAKFKGKPEIFFADAFTKLTYLISNRDVVTASLLFTEDDNKIEFANSQYIIDADVIVKRLVTNNVEKSFWANKGISINWLRIWNSRLKTNLTYSTSGYKYNFDYTEYGTQDSIKSFEFFQVNKLIHSTFNCELNYNYSKYINLDIGVSFNQSEIEYNSLLYNQTEMSIDTKEKPYHIAVFLQNKSTLFERLNLTMGLRSTYNQLTKKVYLEPRFASYYQLNNNWILKSSFGRYYQFVVKNIDGNSHLDGNATWVAANDKDSFVSSAYNISLGAKYEDKNIIFDVEYFYNLRQNIFAFPSLKNVYVKDEKIENISDGYTTGFEVQLIKKLGKVTGWLSYAYNKSEFTTIVNNKDRSFIPDNNIPNTFKFVLQFNFPSWHCTLITNYVSGKPYTIPNKHRLKDEMVLLFPDQINSNRLNDMLRFDISFVKKVDLDFVKGEIGFSLYNIFNNKNILDRFYYLATYQYLNDSKTYFQMNKSDKIDFRFTPSFFLKITL